MASRERTVSVGGKPGGDKRPSVLVPSATRDTRPAGTPASREQARAQRVYLAGAGSGAAWRDCSANAAGAHLLGGKLHLHLLDVTLHNLALGQADRRGVRRVLALFRGGRVHQARHQRHAQDAHSDLADLVLPKALPQATTRRRVTHVHTRAAVGTRTTAGARRAGLPGGARCQHSRTRRARADPASASSRTFPANPEHAVRPQALCPRPRCARHTPVCAPLHPPPLRHRLAPAPLLLPSHDWGAPPAGSGCARLIARAHIAPFAKRPWV